MAKEYSSVKYLSMARNGSQIEDISEVIQEVIELDQAHKSIFDAEVVAVVQLDKHKTCLRCKARVEPATPECNMLQRFDVLSSAKLLFMAGSKFVSLHVSGSILHKMA